MRIAALYFPTSSVGGINSVLVSLREQATACGDTFDVIESGKQKTIDAHKLDRPQLIRGGDTFITVHGRAPHSPEQIDNTIAFLEANYDALFFSTICPHETKDYSEPLFAPLYDRCKLPKVAFITDAYWDTYKHWASGCISFTRKTFVTNPSYAKPIIAEGFDVEALNTPFFPLPIPDGAERHPEPYGVWTSQWKQIKNINNLMPVIPAITDICAFDMFSNGIRYYQMRTSEKADKFHEAYCAAIGEDFFAPEYTGNGKARFFGYQPLEFMPAVYTQAHFMIDLQGLGKPKYAAYTDGSYNCTAIESLYYGSCPILAAQARKSAIPSDLYLTVEDATEIPDVIRSGIDSGFFIDPERQRKARDYVEEHHHVRSMYSKVKEAFS